MAILQEKPDFINDNVDILGKRMNGQYSSFLESKPTWCTYYHINSKRSTVDEGTKNIADLLSDGSPIRYNKILKFPIYDIKQIELDLQENEQGLDLDYNSDGLVLPKTIYPVPDDYFTIDYLGKRFMFRVTHVSYDTVRSNGFYKIEYTLKACHESYADKLDKLSVETYYCIYENIGTDDKCIIRDFDYKTLEKIDRIVETLRTEYLEKFWDKTYNALMYLYASNKYLYDVMLNTFANKTRVLCPKESSTEAILFYEEKRQYYGMDFEDSIYDRIMHKDLEDLNDINTFFGMEPAISTESIFDYYRDENAKYMTYYHKAIGPFQNTLLEYIPEDFVNAIDYRNVELLKDPFERFVCCYMLYEPEYVKSIVDTVDKRRIKYNFHTFIFVPLVIYALRQLLKQIVCDTSTMDEDLIDELN